MQGFFRGDQGNPRDGEAHRQRDLTLASISHMCGQEGAVARGMARETLGDLNKARLEAVLRPGMVGS